jgi:prolyl 4-hydroxylase
MQQSAESFRKQAARAAYGWGRPQNWEDALALLRSAAEAGEEGADRELELLSQAPVDEVLNPPPMEMVSDTSQIAVCRGFAPPGFSEWLIDHARDRLVEAKVNEAEGSGDGLRTARDCAFGPQQRDLVLAVIQTRAQRLLGIPVSYHEPPNVLSYEPGQRFDLHADFIDPRPPEYQAELRALGQRTATIVTYLNEDYEAGETVFPNAGVKFRGRTGDAMIWVNVLRDGSPDYGTMHQALPPTSGRKWVLSQWIRSKPFPYRPQDLL